MSRYAKKNTITELKRDIIKFCKNYYSKQPTDELYEFNEVEELDSCIEVQLYQLIINTFSNSKDKKIVFDFENIITPFDDEIGNCYGLGFYQLGDYAVMLCYAGGDWEIPVYFAIYIDDNNKLRMYIPTKGNSFNPYTKTAYGSEEETELDHIKVWKSLPKEWKADPDYVMEDSDGYFEFSEAFEEYKENLYSNMDDIYNINEMLDDIKNRIVIK